MADERRSATPSGPLVAEYRVVDDPRVGYRRLDPLPEPDELDGWYESHYRDLLDKGGRAPDLARLVAGGPDAGLEREWQAATLHADVIAALDAGVAEGAPRTVLDVGCGTGELLHSLVTAGWDALGTEPATGIADIGRARGLRIESTTAAAFLTQWRAAGGARFGGITLLNVLEHLPDPAALVHALLPALAPAGRLIVRVPNDFNKLQLAAQQALGGDAWWVAVPDHVNYFDHDSVARLLESAGFEVVDRSADFPMELFLLMGDDYRNNAVVGRAAHARRRNLEMALDTDTRRRLGHAWAAAGLGRNAFVVARPRS